MHILICGAGQTGKFLINYLSQQNNIVTIIDQDAEAIENINAQFDVQGFTGMASDPDVLKSAGALDADVLITLTNSDEQNLIICQVATMFFNIPIKICRLRRLSYLEARSLKLFSSEALNIDFVFSLEQLLMQKVMRCLTYPGIRDNILLSGDYHLIGVQPKEGSNILTKPLEQTLSHTDIMYRLTAIIRLNKWIIPKKQTFLQAQDTVYFIAHEDTIEDDIKLFGYYSQNVSRLLFVGNIHYLQPLVQGLQNVGKNYILRVVENDPVIAEKMAEISNQMTVVIGDIMEDQSFLEEQIQYAEAVICVTPQDEKNAVLSLTSKYLDPKTLTFTLMNYLNLPELSQSLGINVLLSQRQLLLSNVLKYTRTGFYKSLSSLHNSLYEFWETPVSDNSYVKGLSTQHFEKNKHFRLCGIIRHNQLLLMNESSIIESKDILLLMVEKQYTADLEKTLGI